MAERQKSPISWKTFREHALRKVSAPELSHRFCDFNKSQFQIIEHIFFNIWRQFLFTGTPQVKYLKRKISQLKSNFLFGFCFVFFYLGGSFRAHNDPWFLFLSEILMSVYCWIRWGCLIDFAWKIHASLNSIVVFMWYLVNRWESCKVANLLFMQPYDNERKTKTRRAGT